MKKTKENYHHGNLKMQMINEAINDMSNRLNLSDIKIKNIAEKLNVTPSATYRHFKDLNDFHFQIILSGLKKLCAIVEILENPKDLTTNYVFFAYNNPSLYQAAFQNNLNNEKVLSLKEELITSINKLKKKQISNEKLELFAILHGMSSVAILLNEQGVSFDDAYKTVLEPYRELLESIL